MCLPEAPLARTRGDTTHLACIQQSCSSILFHRLVYLYATRRLSFLPIIHFHVSEWKVARFVLPRLCIGACIPEAGTQQQAVNWNVDPVVDCRSQPPLRFVTGLISLTAWLRLHWRCVRNFAYHLPGLPTFFRPPSILSFQFAKLYRSQHGSS